MKFINFYEQFVDKFDTPKYSKLTKISILKFMFNKPYLNTSRIPANEGLKSKLDCVESKNSCVLLINVINFKLSLIILYTFF